MCLQCTRWVFGGYFIHFLAMYLQCTCQVHQPLPPVSHSPSTGANLVQGPKSDPEAWSDSLIFFGLFDGPLKQNLESEDPRSPPLYQRCSKFNPKHHGVWDTANYLEITSMMYEDHKVKKTYDDHERWAISEC